MPQFLIALLESVETTRNMATFALILTRVMVIITLVPFLGAKNAPPEVKMGTGITLTFILWPTVQYGLVGDIPVNPAWFILMMLKEAFVGLVVGMVCAEVFYVVEMAGQLIDMLRGANQIQVAVPELTARSSAFGTLQYQLLLALFLALRLHELFIESLFESFIIVPLDAWPRMHAGFWPLADHMIRLSADLISVGVLLALPVGIVCLIVETAFGLMNRVAPQINAYFMAMPAKVISGCMIFFVATGSVLDQMVYYARHFLHRVDVMLELLR